MTQLTQGKKLARETAALDRKRSITVKLEPRFLEIGLKGTRERYAVGYDVILDVARKIEARRKLDSLGIKHA